MEQSMIDTIRDHVGIEKQQVESNRRYLEKCKENDVPVELQESIEDSIQSQEAVLTRSQEVLTQLSESESDTEEKAEVPE